MKVADFDFSLPENLVAIRPLKDRAGSRLLVVHSGGMIEHKTFSDIPLYLNKGDILLINDTKVFPARLTGFKKNGGKMEILLVRQKSNNTWEVLSKGKFTGIVKISAELRLELHDGKTAHFECSGDLMATLWKYGKMPLPPYIRRLPDESDKESYQTVFAKSEGSIAAPTAGLHFTDELLKKIISKGIVLKELTLHVGTGTFRPVRSENVEEHSMDAEYFQMDKGLISEIEDVKSSGRRVICVGTTTTRAIEGYVSGRCKNTDTENRRGGDTETVRNAYSPFRRIRDSRGLAKNGTIRGYTDLFIYPGYNFNIVDSLITNFHLPRSTPLMLASAFCGREKLLKAYKEAIAEGYRFLSYGDAMLIL